MPSNYFDFDAARKKIGSLGALPGIRDQWLNQFDEQTRPLQWAQSQLPDMEMINRLFNVSAGNLSQRGYQARGRAQSDFGALAGARGLLNPGAGIQGAGNSAMAPYINALGSLEEGRAKAQTQLPYQNLQALLPFLQMFQQQNQFQQQMDQNEPNFWDYAKIPLSLGSLELPGGGSLFGKLLFPSLYKG